MMTAEIIPFPESRVFRSAELVDCFEKLELIASYRASGDPHKIGVAEIMAEYWNAERDRLLGGSASGTVH